MASTAAAPSRERVSTVPYDPFHSTDHGAKAGAGRVLLISGMLVLWETLQSCCFYSHFTGRDTEALGMGELPRHHGTTRRWIPGL